MARRLTASRAREILRYEPDTGHIYRRKPNGTERRIGGRMAIGYLQFSVDREMQLAHRVAWLLHTGEWPSGQIDHINGDRADNRLCNLRDVDQFTNMQNMRAAPKSAASGVLGASPSLGRFRACIRVNGKFKHIGRYATPEEAHAAYVAAKRAHHPGNTL